MGQKIWPIHAIEYSPGINRNEIFKNAATWVSLETINLTHGSQSEKRHIIFFNLYTRSERGKSTETER